MALEAMILQQDPFGYGCEDLIYSMGGEAYWGCDDHDHVNIGLQEQDKGVLGILETDVSELSMIRETWDTSSASHGKGWDLNSSPEMEKREAPPVGGGRRKRRRAKSSKNKEELENQRMTHIAVERNRRRQMNDYLAVLRSLMPSSYVQRGDQASIVGGAINFVKELEQLLQTMEAQNRSTNNDNKIESTTTMSTSPIFAHFFSFPQYTTRRNSSTSPSSSSSGSSVNNNNNKNGEARQWVSAAEIEVTMVESHAHLKILSKKRPKQLLKMVAAFQSLSLTVLHLNVTTTTDRLVLYSVSVKVEEGSQVNTVDEIACAVNKMLWRIQEEASLIT